MALLLINTAFCHTVHANQWGTATGATNSITSNGITWTLLSPAPAGTYINGDPWVVGPVTVTTITNSLNSPLFTPRLGQNGSMVNPNGSTKQGYDESLSNYKESLNAGLPNGLPVSADNPLKLQANTSLISMVSWLWDSESGAEPGAPVSGSGLRPYTRSGAVLTVLSSTPPKYSFRPAYAGNNKTVQFQLNDLDLNQLNTLPPPTNTPALPELEDSISRTWFDHLGNWQGALLHPSENMPNYGREIGCIMVQAALMLQLDFNQLPERPSKEKLLIGLIQFGIDSNGVADAGGGFTADGGHMHGRKMPILFAGLLLNDSDMQAVGTWGRNDGTPGATGTPFQEFQTHFYVSQTEVDFTHSAEWKPDSRRPAVPYEVSDIGTPEWGIRHSYKPSLDNAYKGANYRHINGKVNTGTALAVEIMGGRTL